MICSVSASHWDVTSTTHKAYKTWKAYKTDKTFHMFKQKMNMLLETMYLAKKDKWRKWWLLSLQRRMVVLTLYMN